MKPKALRLNAAELFCAYAQGGEAAPSRPHRGWEVSSPPIGGDVRPKRPCGALWAAASPCRKRTNTHRYRKTEFCRLPMVDIRRKM